MRPLRIFLLLSTFILSFVLFISLLISPWRSSSNDFQESHTNSQSNFRAFLSWHSPSTSLFPPSAIISLTDDNSTFFLARPAAFGPLLPAKSLSGQLWIGSGFGEERDLGRGVVVGGAEGELGCSDVPGWYDGEYALKPAFWGSLTPKNSVEGARRRNLLEMKMLRAAPGAKNRRTSEETDDTAAQTSTQPGKKDGTDDHLHHPLPASGGVRTNGETVRSGGQSQAAHADIQSLQESAEIAGKIVLLSRGGCGFLEKVKWVQRRGGVALIVGDDQRGGQLVTMYARGDTSNVTIPALFTSHTTAHLLSSLIPSGKRSGSMNEGVVRSGLALGSKSDGRPGPQPAADAQDDSSTESELLEDEGSADTPRTWLQALFGSSRRPPTSGSIVLSAENGSETSKKDHALADSAASTGAAPKPLDEGFVIGIHDWRDPDMVAYQRESIQGTPAASTAAAAPTGAATMTLLRNSVITPKSGVYAGSRSGAAASQDMMDDYEEDDSDFELTSGHGWLYRAFFGSDDRFNNEPEDDDELVTSASSSEEGPSHHHQHLLQDDDDDDTSPPHDGLWVTLTPTSMSSSPFFDTLLVLVVSPLVTLTVVYALLLLRSRIRRRRWRAPKSVVEQLPVRTYHTIPTSASASSSSSAASTVSSSAADRCVDASTPLLQAAGGASASSSSTAQRPTRTRPRPRAQTTPVTSAIDPHSPSHEIHETSHRHQRRHQRQHRRISGAGAPEPSSPSTFPSTSPLSEKERRIAAGLAEWRRRYGGKQRECVVCLEEYVDGVSRVMSLPCGHEFHAECITPWLTTRRRTCPICKGDVVRSLASAGGPPGASSSTMQNDYVDAEDDFESSSQQSSDNGSSPMDAIQQQALLATNDDPASAQPLRFVTRGEGGNEERILHDLERGVVAVERSRSRSQSRTR